MPARDRVLHRLAALLAAALWIACAPGSEGERAGGAPAGIPAEGPVEGPKDVGAAVLDPVPALLARRLHALGVEPEFLLAADLDGDGRRELAVTSNEPGEVRLVSRGGERRIPVGGWPLRPLAVPHGDGARLVVPSREARELEWIDPRRAPPAAIVRRAPLPATPRAAAAGDLGADGTPDIAVACDQRALVVFGEGGAPLEAELSGELPRCAAIAADGSGLWVGFQDTRSVSFRPFRGGALGPPRTVALGGIPRDLIEADLDGDGDLELAVAGGDDLVWVFGWGRRGGASAWDEAEPLRWRAKDIPLDLEAGDLDGDGRSELVVTHAASLVWLEWGGFTADGPARVRWGEAGQTPRDGALLDLDADGDLDLAVTNRDSGALSLVWNVHGGLFVPPGDRVGGFPTRLLLVDVEPSPGVEALCLLAKDDALRITRFRPEGAVAGPLVRVGPTPRGLVPCDLEGDGAPDLALLTSDAHGARLVVVSRGSRGAWGVREDIAAPDLGGQARDLLARDLTGDGVVDLVFVDAEGGRVGWCEGRAAADGAPGWGPRRELPLGPAPRRVIALAPAAEAPPLLAVGLAGPGEGRGVAFLEPDTGPDGLVLRVGSRIELPLGAIDLAPGDLDGDGDTDLLALLAPAAEGARGALVALLAEGGGWRAGEPLATSAGSRHVALEDLDRDGTPDALVAAQYAHVVDLFLGRPGSATGFVAADGIGAAVGPFDVAVHDVTGDGRPDVVAIAAHSDLLVVLEGCD